MAEPPSPAPQPPQPAAAGDAPPPPLPLPPSSSVNNVVHVEKGVGNPPSPLGSFRKLSFRKNSSTVRIDSSSPVAKLSRSDSSCSTSAGRIHDENALMVNAAILSLCGLIFTAGIFVPIVRIYKVAEVDVHCSLLCYPGGSGVLSVADSGVAAPAILSSIACLGGIITVLLKIGLILGKDRKKPSNLGRTWLYLLSAFSVVAGVCALGAAFSGEATTGCVISWFPSLVLLPMLIASKRTEVLEGESEVKITGTDDCSQGGGRLEMIDMTDPRSPTLRSVITDDGDDDCLDSVERRMSSFALSLRGSEWNSERRTSRTTANDILAFNAHRGQRRLSNAHSAMSPRSNLSYGRPLRTAAEARAAYSPSNPPTSETDLLDYWPRQNGHVPEGVAMDQRGSVIHMQDGAMSPARPVPPMPSVPQLKRSGSVPCEVNRVSSLRRTTGKRGSVRFKDIPDGEGLGSPCSTMSRSPPRRAVSIQSLTEMLHEMDDNITTAVSLQSPTERKSETSQKESDQTNPSGTKESLISPTSSQQVQHALHNAESEGALPDWLFGNTEVTSGGGTDTAAMSPGASSAVMSHTSSVATVENENEKNNKNIREIGRGWRRTSLSAMNQQQPSTTKCLKREDRKFSLASGVDSELPRHASFRSLLSKIGSEGSEFSGKLSVRSVVETDAVQKGTSQHGNKIVNNLELLKILGKGSYSTVKLCRDTSSGEFFAAKIYKKSLLRHLGRFGGRGAQLTTAMHKVKQEIAILKKLCHRNLVRLYSVIDDSDSDKLLLIMEYIHKGCIGEVDTATGKLTTNVFTEATAQGVFVGIVSALRYLHKCKVIHRDIKPENILLNAQGVPKLADFGVSHVFSSVAGDYLSRTEGTPAYLPPEACSGGSYHGCQGDIWALGVTLYVMLIGELPFHAKDRNTLKKSILKDTPVLPNTLSSNCRELLGGLMKKDARWRPSLREVFYHAWFRTTSLNEVPNLLLQPGLPHTQHRLSAGSSNCRTLNFTDIPEVESRRVSATSQRSRRLTSESGGRGKSPIEYSIDVGSHIGSNMGSNIGSHPSASTSGPGSLPSIESAVAQMPPPAPRSSSQGDASRSSSVETNEAVIRLPDPRLPATAAIMVSIPKAPQEESPEQVLDKVSISSDIPSTPTPLPFSDDGSECADEPDAPSLSDNDLEDAITFIGSTPHQTDIPADVATDVAVEAAQPTAP
eukprot:TRINITY_DN22638_c0_g1_i1.p1 TRINITY_DN22638_c0_g1~~TRINITY_DN22638_c0_g1_i1.p1  ORF type:complete len:1200 (+),score=191.35 TRINITY_DN22638_c0_g1_i1:37-3636(+)